MTHEESARRIFNSMSFTDRWALKGMAVALTISDSVKQEIKVRPWTYPLFVPYVLLMAAPIPGIGVGLIFASYLFTRMRLTPFHEQLDKNIKEAMQTETLMDTFNRHVLETRDGVKRHYKLDRSGLGWAATKKGLGDLASATATFCGYCRDLFVSRAP